MVRCSAEPPASDVVATQVLQIQAKTELPANVSQKTFLPTESLVIIPAQLAQMGTVVRPRAEVRQGPSASLPISDRFLIRGTRVLVFEKIAVWCRVLDPIDGLAGWVHQDALSQIHSLDNNVKINTGWLPTDFAHENVNEVYDYATLSVKRLSIPKGTMFRVLMRASGRTLIWIPETNSVAWVGSEHLD